MNVKEDFGHPGSKTSNERSETPKTETHVVDVNYTPVQQPNESKELQKFHSGPTSPEIKDAKGEVNMEASVMADDVVKAGGFGATDGIGSFLPVAMDSTDFEASLRNARDFEEPQSEISRPGLGFVGSG
ncbi:hypothetical protein H6P81_007679 [Aristolochia fimbriata]|uniref:Uncharacterized protein n=1 Tax=Aristolochia fimbriata TaxID=158543 RepID=A0AAV7F0X8_ARIFI|nr:hypothetical protein H6P81_007679 [Aristolochia fimbriata]